MKRIFLIAVLLASPAYAQESDNEYMIMQQAHQRMMQSFDAQNQETRIEALEESQREMEDKMEERDWEASLERRNNPNSP